MRKEMFLHSNKGIAMHDPTRTVTIEVLTNVQKFKIKSKKFNPLWIINPLAVLICALLAFLISFFGYKYGGELALITSMYPAFMLGRIATFFIIDVEHEFWNIEYEEIS